MRSSGFQVIGESVSGRADMWFRLSASASQHVGLFASHNETDFPTVTRLRGGWGSGSVSRPSLTDVRKYLFCLCACICMGLTTVVSQRGV